MAFELYRVVTPQGPRYVKHLQTKQARVQLVPVNMPWLAAVGDEKPFWISLLQFRSGLKRRTIVPTTQVPCSNTAAKCAGYMHVRILHQRTRLLCSLCDVSTEV